MVSLGWWRRLRRREAPGAVERRVRGKYASFRDLLTLNSEALELIAGLQEDLQYVPARRDVVQERVAAIFDRAAGVVQTLEQLSGRFYRVLTEAVAAQRSEVERFLAASQELVAPRLAARLTELGAPSVDEAGGKAALLAEVKNKVGLPVPDGFVLTTEAYRQFCGIPLWEQIRDALRSADLEDLEALQATAAGLQQLVLEQPLPRAVEVAITERARWLDPQGQGLAVRSSAVGEGGELSRTTYAGQFLSLINVPPDQAVMAYRRLIAARFSERALSYRLSTGLLEVETPMAVLFLPVIRARASGIMYTRDPADPKRRSLWITATLGLGMEIASGRLPADLFVVSHQRPFAVQERNLANKAAQIILEPGGGTTQAPLERARAEAPSLADPDIQTLAAYGVALEEHFKGPQDVEWAVDEDGQCWILQTRPLSLVQAARTRTKARSKAEPLLAGGRTVYPGQVSGPAHLVESLRAITQTPQNAIVFLHRPSPEIVQVFPRIGGLVAEWGNLAGHAAALLREFRIPSVFMMTGAFERLQPGEPVSLDAVQGRVFPGTLFEGRVGLAALSDNRRATPASPISHRLLTLNLLDPTAASFRPAGCQSAHDVLRFCHERAVEAMFDVNDLLIQKQVHATRRLRTELPLNLFVLDVGGGLRLEDPEAREITPRQVVSRPFQALWRGISHPQVSWRRELPSKLSDFASVMAESFSSQASSTRALGEVSYLLVAEEYFNLNSRLAYHFSLVDACLSANPVNNHVSFRFAGGGATRQRRNLRARFLEACLTHYGFRVDRRGDLVNAWLKKAPAEETEAGLDMLGRLMACSNHLDMFMAGTEVMRWYVRQFLAGNYSFRPEQAPPPAVG